VRNVRLVTILVVEDNRHMRRVLVEMTRSAFTTESVVEAESASSARRQVRDVRPELVLMDVHLPDGSGIALTAEILFLLPRSKVVIVSNEQGGACRAAARNAGASAYIAKDDAYAALVPTMTALLGGMSAPAQPAARWPS
jgi:DNA-binding NarL/FixJ family response regulator